MLARLCSKSFMLGFSSTWTENFQMYKMDLEKADEPEIKLPTSVCWIIEKAREFPKNIYFCFIDYTEAFVWITTNCGIFLNRWEYKTTLPASCMQDKKQVRIGHETMDWFIIGKGVHKGCILSPCLFKFYAEYIMRNAGLEEAQAGIKIARRNINNLMYADDSTLMGEREEELKSLLLRWKRRGKNWLKTQYSKSWHPVPSLLGK